MYGKEFELAYDLDLKKRERVASLLLNIDA